MKLPASIARHRGKLLLLLVLAAAVWWLLSRPGGLSKEMIMDYGHRLPVFGFAAAFLILPLMGFPISPLLILAGLRFGFAGGMALACAEIAVHNFIAFHLVHGRLREKVSRYLTRKGYSIPTPAEKSHVWFTLLFASVHGPPYAAKLYLLALTEVPFRIYFWLGVPVYVLFSAIPVGAGSSVIAVNPLWLYGAILALTGVAFFGRWLHRRVARRLQPDLAESSANGQSP